MFKYFFEIKCYFEKKVLILFAMVTPFSYLTSPHLPKQWLDKKKIFPEVRQFCLEILVIKLTRNRKFHLFLCMYLMRSQQFLEPCTLRFQFPFNFFFFSCLNWYSIKSMSNFQNPGWGWLEASNSCMESHIAIMCPFFWKQQLALSFVRKSHD